MKFKGLVELLDKQKSLSDRKNEVQDQSFAISTLQDGKASALLYRLGENVRKQDFEGIPIGEGKLNSLCKIFAISHPYSAIGLVKDEVYIALSQIKPIGIKKLISISTKLVNADLESDSCIPIVAEFYKVLSESDNQYAKRILHKKEIAYSKVKSANCDLFTYAASDYAIFSSVFNAGDIRNIKDLLARKITFKQFIPSQDELHIHVELNLVAAIQKDHGKVDITIGLASSNILDEVGSCGYCVATMDSVSELNSINIGRSKDFPQNIPNGHWDFPHKLLNTGEKTCLFFQKLFEQYKPIVKQQKGNLSAYELLGKKLQEFGPYFFKIRSLDKQLQENDEKIREMIFQWSTNVNEYTQTDVHALGKSSTDHLDILDTQ